MKSGKVAVLVVVGVLVIAGIAIGGWQLNWWLANSAANHNAIITQNGYAAQSAYVQEVRTLVVEIDAIQSQISDPATPASEVSSLTAQKAAETNQACNLANNITENVPSDIAQFISTSCS